MSTQRKDGLMNKQWRCIICGYIHVGEDPPFVCPICNAPRKMFERIEGGDDAAGRREKQQ
jgi:rubrerythrin